jgi:hypothetical protein
MYKPGERLAEVETPVAKSEVLSQAEEWQ